MLKIRLRVYFKMLYCDIHTEYKAIRLSQILGIWYFFIELIKKHIQSRPKNLSLHAKFVG